MRMQVWFYAAHDFLQRRTLKGRVNTLATKSISWSCRFLVFFSGGGELEMVHPIPSGPNSVPRRVKLIISWCGQLGASKGEPRVKRA